MREQKKIISTLKNRAFHRNRGRNLAAILAIILTTMMFTTLSTLAQSLSRNMEDMYLRQSGTAAHATVTGLTDSEIDKLANHPEIVSFGKSIVVGLAENLRLAGRQVEIRYASGQYAEDDFAYPTTGKMPENKDEIALDTLTIERLGIPLKLGQTVTLEWRKDLYSSETTSSSFTLCGWWEGNLSVYASMAWVSEDFALEACGDVSAPADGQILGLRMVGISFADSRDLDAKTTAILADCGLKGAEAKTNITYSPEVQYSIFSENLPMYEGMALVFLAGFFIIYNIFQISITQDIQFYGKLKTLGMTKRQVKKLVYGQGNRLSLIGIPLGLVFGYILGAVLVPLFIVTTGTEAFVSANPIIFIGSALFSYITTTVSCMLPAHMAGKVSPVEASRYTDANTGVKKESKKAGKGAVLPAMAWANLWRGRTRTIMVICSLTLGFVLMSFFYAKALSFDIEKYLMDMAVADFELDDATNSSPDGYDPKSRTISDELIKNIKALGTEETGSLYSKQVELALSEQTQSNLKNFYTKERLDDFASYAPTFPEWKEKFDLAIGGAVCNYTVYGADGLILQAAASENYILNGNFDAEKFETGAYCLAVGPSIEAGEDSPTYSVGEKVSVLDREFEVMAIVSELQPMTAGTGPVFDLPFVLPADVFTELWPEGSPRKFYFNVPDEVLDEAASLLADFQRGTAVGMNIVSRQALIEQFESQTRASSVIGYAISVIVALVGVLNFINSMVTAIISRKREFAVMQSIGMTNRQLRRLLMLEGLYYAGVTLLFSYSLGALTVGVIVRKLVYGGFSTFHFTLLPLVVCTPILIIFAVAIPYICFRNLEKQSIVERLRATD